MARKLIARGELTATVEMDHGTRKGCNSSDTTRSKGKSPNVFVEGVGVVREGDKVEVHNKPGCGPHAPKCDTYSPDVFANTKGIACVGDTYAGPGTHVITKVGQSSTYANS